MGAALRLALRLRLQITDLGMGITVYALVHQGMSGVQQPFHLLLTVTLLAVHDVGFGEFQIIQNAFCIGPLLEAIIILDQLIMAAGRMRAYARLHPLADRKSTRLTSSH